MPIPSDRTDPRSSLEAKEDFPEANHDELAFALGRLLIWLLAGQTLPRIGMRCLILAYKLRPDLINGSTLEEIARRGGKNHRPSAAHNLAARFTRTFGISGLNSRLDTRKHRAAWERLHPGGRSPPHCSEHLQLANRFAEWLARAKQMPGLLPTSNEGKARMLQELGPVRAFIASLEDRE